MTTTTPDHPLIAEIIVYDNVGMLAIALCDRCQKQAWVEVLMKDSEVHLLFCAHHAGVHWPKLLTLNCLISDHRPFLEAEESKSPAAAASK